MIDKVIKPRQLGEGDGESGRKEDFKKHRSGRVCITTILNYKNIMKIITKTK